VEVRIVDIVEDADGRMSSSRIRSALEQGALTQAEALLGRPYRFQGKVVAWPWTGTGDRLADGEFAGGWAKVFARSGGLRRLGSSGRFRRVHAGRHEPGAATNGGSQFTLSGGSPSS
jgi:hypothetical protein